MKANRRLQKVGLFGTATLPWISPMLGGGVSFLPGSRLTSQALGDRDSMSRCLRPRHHPTRFPLVRAGVGRGKAPSPGMVSSSRGAPESGHLHPGDPGRGQPTDSSPTGGLVNALPPTSTTPTQDRSYAQARTISQYINLCLETYREHPFLAELHGPSLTYGQVAAEVEVLRQTLKKVGVRPGDRVALLGLNSIHWAVAYLAVVTHGAVAVPILTEFHPTAIHNIINMSGSQAIFVPAAGREAPGRLLPRRSRRRSCWRTSGSSTCTVAGVPQADQEIVGDLRERAEQFMTEHNLPFHRQDASRRPRRPGGHRLHLGHDRLLQGRHADPGQPGADVLAAVRYVDLSPADRFLSLLPLAHTYECTCCFLAPCAAAPPSPTSQQKPSPKVLQAAFAEVKPTLVFAVPLIIEKIYRKKVLPRIRASCLLRSTDQAAVAAPAGVPEGRRRRCIAGLRRPVRFMGFGGAALARRCRAFPAHRRLSLLDRLRHDRVLAPDHRIAVVETRQGSCGTPVARDRAAHRRPGARDRRRRGAGARPDGHPGATTRTRRPRAALSRRTAGCAPATSGSRTRTASSTSRAARRT